MYRPVVKFYLVVTRYFKQTRNISETCMPLSLNFAETLTFDLETPNAIGLIF